MRDIPPVAPEASDMASICSCHMDTEHTDITTHDANYQRKVITLLIWLGNMLNQLDKPDQMVQRTAELITDALPVQCWLLVTPTSLDPAIGYQAHHGTGSALPVNTTAHLLAHEAMQWVQQQAETIIAVDLADEARWHTSPHLPNSGSALVIALRHRSTPLGILLVLHPTPDYFRVEDILLLQSVAAQLGTALNAVFLHQLEQQRREHTYTMLAFSRSVTTERSLIDLVQTIREYSLHIFGTRQALLFIQHPTSTLIPVRVLSGRLYMHKSFQDEISELACVAWDTAQMQKQHLKSVPDLPALAVPLIANGQQVGVLTLVGDTANSLDFPASTWSLLTVFANAIAATCANLLLQQEQQQHMQQLEQQVVQRTRQLQASRDALRAMVDTLADGMLLLDTDETVLVVNRAFSETILGRHPREVVGMPYEAIWNELEQRGMHLTAQRSTMPDAPGGRQVYAVKCRNALGIVGWYLVKRDPVYSDELSVERYLEYWETMA